MNSFSSKAHITAAGAKLDIYRLDALVGALTHLMLQPKAEPRVRVL